MDIMPNLHHVRNSFNTSNNTRDDDDYYDKNYHPSILPRDDSHAKYRMLQLDDTHQRIGRHDSNPNARINQQKLHKFQL